MSDTDWQAFADEVRERVERRSGKNGRLGESKTEEVREAVGEVLDNPTKVTFFAREVAELVDMSPSVAGGALRLLEEDGFVRKVNSTKPHKWERVE